MSRVGRAPFFIFPSLHFSPFLKKFLKKSTPSRTKEKEFPKGT